MLEYEHKIEEIISILDGIRPFFAEFEGIFTNALNGIQDSRARALIGETRLAKMLDLASLLPLCLSSVLYYRSVS